MESRAGNEITSAAPDESAPTAAVPDAASDAAPDANAERARLLGGTLATMGAAYVEALGGVDRVSLDLGTVADAIALLTDRAVVTIAFSLDDVDAPVGLCPGENPDFPTVVMRSGRVYYLAPMKGDDAGKIEWVGLPPLPRTVAALDRPDAFRAFDDLRETCRMIRDAVRLALRGRREGAAP